MFRTSIEKAILGSVLGIGICATALADRTWDFRVSDCRAGTVVVTFEYPGNPPIPVPIPIPMAMSASQKAAWIRDHIGPAWQPTANGDTFTVRTDSRIHVTFSTGDTAERRDSITTASAQSAVIRFEGFFAPPPNPQPAIFTAGIITDVGELVAQVSAQELNFQTDGPIICQALFQRLAPRAPQYGGLINYAGDRLEIYFDPAYTVTQGGVIFGTTSPSPGCSGTVTPPEEDPPCVGDINGDGFVDLNDLAIVLSSYGLAPGDNGYNPGADLNGNGVVDLDDLTIALSRFGTHCP